MMTPYLSTTYVVALLYLIICDVNFIPIPRGGETQQYQSGKASRGREHLEAYLIQAEFGDLRFLKSNGVCESL
ncbi:hypothetical protein N7455_004164 [Penicillium solitum]|uniref:uncharacterized protein n=1 Tax=Penicillium solitum TaxID=60172 RepID=UPI0032C47482|nr:hypothetical protein N7455_004164 [Penicillium solitum]